MQRQREIAVGDEEELLRMQEQFTSRSAAASARPAAKAVRIIRKSPAAPTSGAAAPAPAAACPAHGAGCAGNHDQQEQQPAADLMAALQSAMKDIVGEVRERQPATDAPPVPPSPPAPLAPAAPPATHRKASKFALGRQRQRWTGEGSGSVPVAAPALPHGALTEEAAIDAENRHLLAAMTQSQLEEAREEALQRLPPAAVEFLRRRGAERARNAAAAATAPGPAPGPSASAAGQQAQAVAAPGARAQQQQQRAGRGGGRLQERRGGGPTRPPPSATQASAAARLRFDVEGRVVGLCPAGTDAEVAPADVVERDPIRLGGGSDAEGYSVREACVLARSRLSQQRVLALRLLAAVLARSRPSAATSTPRPVPLPAEVAAELGGAAPAGQAAWLCWEAVWHHALHAAEVATLLRRSLDDPHPAVTAAAAQALAALLGAAGPAGAAEEEAAEAADCAPLTGWPAPPLRHMQRPSEAGGWVVAPAGAQRLGGEGEEGEEVDEQQLARADPLTGLLHMSLAERAAYLLGREEAAAALDPLLSILIKCCQAGKDAADALLDAPAMVDALGQLLDAPPPPAAAAGDAAPGGGGGAAAAHYAARPKALRLLRQLACSSKAAARLLQEAGLVRCAVEQLLRSLGEGSTAVAAADARQLGALTESLRLWRCFAQHGFFLASMDDAFATLCPHLAPSLPAAAAAAARACQPLALPPGDLRRWCVAREAFATAAQLCWHAARHGPAGEEQVSPQCAAALAAGALAWLEGLPLSHLVQAGGCNGGSLATADDDSSEGLARGLSPSPALSAAGGGSGHAAALLGTLASALHLVGSYWGVQRWHTRAEKDAAAQRLAALGLLPAGGGGEAAPVAQAASALLQRVISSLGKARGPSSLGAALPTAAAELAVALARLAHALLHGAAAAAVAAATLSPLLSQQAAAAFQAAAAAADATLRQPWDAARQLAVLPLARAAAAGLQAASAASTAAGGGAPWDTTVAGTALALLRTLPPGDEATALRVMAALLGPAQLAGPAAAAAASLRAATQSGAAQLAAAGPLGGGDAAGAPPASPSADSLSRLLLPGYAAAWLGLVPERGPPERGGGGDSDAAAAAAVVDAPASTAVLRPEGSRLPLPPDWLLREVPLSPPEAGVAADAATAAACALLLALGWEAQGLGGGAGAEHSLRGAVLLLFGESAAAAGAAVVPGAQACEQGEEEAGWQLPLARWCLADLMQRYCSVPAGAAAAPWGEQEARQLAQHFAAASFGDRLFGAAVALLLRRCVAAGVQLEVLASLADEQALHLLPPLRCLPGPDRAYLSPPPPASDARAGGGGGGGGFGQPCFGGMPSAGATAAARAELGLHLRLLSEGPLQRCLQAGTSDGAPGSAPAGGDRLRDCSAAVPIVLHRLACACFSEGADTADVAQQAQQAQATLCSVLLRCGAAAQPRDADAAALLAMLLRWDTAAGGPSDVVPLERVQAIERACAAAGLEPRLVLGAALEA